MKESPTDETTLMYDIDNRKVGCVLLQALFGCDSQLCHLWNTSCWELKSPANLKKLTTTRERWEWLAKTDNMRVSDVYKT